MSKKIVIEFSFIEEGQNQSEKQIINDIKKVFDEDFVIPWCGVVEKVSINDL